MINFENKQYDYKLTEDALRNSYSKEWKQTVFSIKSTIDKETYSIPMPPPNITGRLHMGHVIFLTIQDAIARFYAQRGATTFWKPGLDHAGIATHEKIIERLPNDYSMEEYEKTSIEIFDENSQVILSQFDMLGIIADWESQYFTLTDMNDITLETYSRLTESGRIYSIGNDIYCDISIEANQLIEALRSDEIWISSASHKNRLVHMLENLEPWCISRNIPWGIKIPDSDHVFDTWFTSSLCAIYTEEPNIPHDLLETGYDILFFWVARMLIIGKFLTGKWSFNKIFLHGLLRDGKGQKFSKSLGNGVDPLELMEKVSTDAIRAYTISNIEMGSDAKYLEQDIFKERKNIQKIYSCARLLNNYRTNFRGMETGIRAVDEYDRNLQNDFESLVESFKLKEAYNLLMNEFKNDFCNTWIQENKTNFDLIPTVIHGNDWEHYNYTTRILNIALEKLLFRMRLLNPFIPFITTAIIEEFSESKIVDGIYNPFLPLTAY